MTAWPTANGVTTRTKLTVPSKSTPVWAVRVAIQLSMAMATHCPSMAGEPIEVLGNVTASKIAPRARTRSSVRQPIQQQSAKKISTGARNQALALK